MVLVHFQKAFGRYKEVCMTRVLVPFFSPQGVALIGASSNPHKIGAAILGNLIQSGYQGRVYPVNPRCDQIAGLPCYGGMADVPDPVDLAVIALPASRTPPALESCGRRGLKAAIIISSGFKETGPAGAAIEAACTAIAQNYGMRLVGPNCLGTMDLCTGLNTTFLEESPAPGRIGFISQSGGVCGGGISYANSKQVGFSRFVSLGNEADVTETDMIAYLAGDSNTHVIVGLRRDPQFGPLVMVGLSGIYVELLTDVTFRVAPISLEDALAMIGETRAGRLLAGLRGRPAADIKAVADCMLRLSQLGLDFPQIEEVEVNPLLVLSQGQGAVALDGRIILSSIEQEGKPYG
jgi:acyl-CoA synthetase (NDP forming)